MCLKWILPVTALVALTAGPVSADGSSSPNYQMPSYVFNSGGATIASANYQMIASIGEQMIGTTSSAGYRGDLGFLATLLSITGQRGDANHDGVINLVDVALLLKVSGNLSIAPIRLDFPNSDVSPVPGDGKIDVRDAARLLRFLNGFYPGGL